jgi:hypothetical protein
VQLSLVRLDPVDGCGLALVPRPCKLFASTTDHLMKAVVALCREMRRCTGSHAFPNGTTVENNHVLPGFDELIGNGHPGNSGTHNDNFSAFAPGE